MKKEKDNKKGKQKNTHIEKKEAKKKEKIKLKFKGALRSYINWPIYLTALLLCMVPESRPLICCERWASPYYRMT